MPIISVAALIINADKVLLVKNGVASNHITNVYGLPSGKVEPGESEIEAAVRELKEESGLNALVKDMQEFPENFYVAKIVRKDGSIKEYGWRVFLCKKYSGELAASDETEPYWIEISQLDSLDLLPNVKSAIIAGINFLHNHD